MQVVMKDTGKRRTRYKSVKMEISFKMMRSKRKKTRQYKGKEGKTVVE